VAAWPIQAPIVLPLCWESSLKVFRRAAAGKSTTHQPGARWTAGETALKSPALYGADRKLLGETSPSPTQRPGSFHDEASTAPGCHGRP
jgi:hypothetical protein